MSHLPNYTIAISSVSGGGKTALVKRASELLQGTALFFDDYASVSTYPLADQLVTAVAKKPRTARSRTVYPAHQYK